MTTEQAKSIHQERQRITALIEHDQQKIDRQLETTQEEYLRWALLNQWQALEKVKQQLSRSADYRADAEAAYRSHFFPRFDPRKEA